MLIKTYEIISTIWTQPFKRFLSQTRSFKYSLSEALCYSRNKAEYALKQKHYYRVNIVHNNIIIAQWNGSPTVGDSLFTQEFRDLLSTEVSNLKNEVENYFIAQDPSDGLVERIDK